MDLCCYIVSTHLCTKKNRKSKVGWYVRKKGQTIEGLAVMPKEDHFQGDKTSKCKTLSTHCLVAVVQYV